MQKPYTIPSFRHSLTQSRKQRNLLVQYDQIHDSTHRDIQTPEPDYQNMLNSLDGMEIGDGVGAHQYWEHVYKVEDAHYRNLESKHNILLESIALHHQALQLHNNQSLDNEIRLSQLQTKLKCLQQKYIKNQQKLEKTNKKSQQTKTQINNIHSKVTKQQSMSIQQEKYISELQMRSQHLIADIHGLKQELQAIMQQEVQLVDITKRNQDLQQYLTRVSGEANITKIKIQKDVTEEESLIRKMHELEKVIKGREKTNRELGKKLMEMKRLYPEAVADYDKEKGNKLKEINRNIRQMEQQSNKLQMEIYEITEKTQSINDKINEKMKSIDLLRANQRKQEQECYQRQRQRQRHRKYQLQNSQMPQMPQIANKPPHQSHSQKQAPHYKIIQSQQNENTILKKTMKHQQTISQMKSQESQEMQGKYRAQSEHMGEMGEHMGNMGEMGEHMENMGEHMEHMENMGEMGEHMEHMGESSQTSGEDESILQINQSLKNLVNKFYKYKTNSLFKH